MSEKPRRESLSRCMWQLANFWIRINGSACCIGIRDHLEGLYVYTRTSRHSYTLFPWRNTVAAADVASSPASGSQGAFGVLRLSWKKWAHIQRETKLIILLLRISCNFP